MKWFRTSEFIQFSKMQPALLEKLDKARDIAGIPFHITSSYRSPEYNSIVGGVANSAHVRGYAVDIRCLDSESRFKIVYGAFCAGFPRIGIGKNFVHLDCDPSLPSPCIWLY